MIDITHLERIAAGAGEKCVVTRRFLKQVAAELAQGREAQRQLEQRGAAFGLGQGITL